MKCALVAIAAPFEAPYIEEWCNAHLKLGYDNIFLYLNDWTDKPKLDKRVILQDIKGRKQQLNAYHDALLKKSSEYSWMTFLDCDEFIDLNGKYADVKQMFIDFQDYDGLCLNWVIYGDSNLKQYEDKPVTKRFIMCDKNLNKHVKSSINLNKMRQKGIFWSFADPHSSLASFNADYFFMSVDKKNVVRGPWNIVDTPTSLWRFPTINHYFCKTRDEYLYRRSFGKADTLPMSSDYFRRPEEFDEHNANDIRRPYNR